MHLKGRVRKEAGRGKGLGFPTANIAVRKDVLDGLYVGWTRFGNKQHASLIFIGVAETFKNTKRQAEIYILDFSGDLYGQNIEVELLQKIRENRKFSSPEELIVQMKEDEKAAKEYFNEKK